MIRWLACVFVLFLGIAPVSADPIYRTTDEDGNVVYTDDPPTDEAEPVELDPLTTVPSVESGARSDGGAAEPREDEGEVTSSDTKITGIRLLYPPSGGQAIRHNGGNVPFRVELQPTGTALPEGYHIEILLDGEVRAAATTTDAVVSPVDRGQHTARVRVVDHEGRKVAESEPAQFHLLRAHLGSP